MLYELLLISTVLAGGYWGIYFVRTRPHGTATFGVMQLAAAALAGLGLIGRSHDAPALGVAGAIGGGAGLCLLLVGPIVRALARRLIGAERIGAARRLLDVAELLAPGSGVAEEKAVLRAMVEIREGRIEQTVEALAAARDGAPADARLAIDERIAMLYLAAHRWLDAIAHAEAHLFGAPPPEEPAGSLRRELGIAPPVWVELLGAYGRVGDLEQAARMVARLEDVCAGRDDAALWIHRARVMFLALAGRPDAVRALVAPRRGGHMTAAARSYWIAVAHEHRGDRGEALAAYQRARARARGRPRALIDQAIADLGALGEPAPVRLGGVATEVVARIEAAPPPPPVATTGAPRTRATWVLAAALLAVAATSAIALAGIGDLGALLRSGALLRGAVDGGEWWRVVSSLFVHVGAAHLVLNAFGLVMLGQLAERLFGSARMIAVFGGSGVAGALASYLASPVGISAGASGAVFGLLGALLVEITWHRGHYREAWRRGLWGGLAVVAVGQFGYGYFYPMIDQWAHGGGLLAGGLLGLVLSPTARWAAWGARLARGLAVAFAAIAIVAGVQVVRTPLADSLGGPPVGQVIDGIAVAVPGGWRTSPQHATGPGARVVLHDLVQPDDLVIVRIARMPPGDPRLHIAAWRAQQEARAAQAARDGAGPDGRARVPSVAADPVIALPAGWEGVELAWPAEEDGAGQEQRHRTIVCGRAFGDMTVLMVIEVPEAIARAAPRLFAALLASISSR